MPLPLDAFSLLRAAPVFAAAPDAALTDLAALGREARFPARTLLAARGQQPDRIWCVLEGAVELGFYSEDGRPALLGPIAPGGWATWLGCFHDAPLPHDLWTGPATRLMAFPTTAVRALAQAHPQVYPAVMAHVGQRLRELISWSLAASLVHPERRLALLLAIACRSGVADGPHRLGLTQDRIAASGFGARQRVARLLAGLVRRGLIETVYGGVIVPSRAALEAFAGP